MTVVDVRVAIAEPVKVAGTVQVMRLGSRALNSMRPINTKKGEFLGVHFRDGHSSIVVMRKKRIWWKPWCFKFALVDSGTLSWGASDRG